MANTASDGTHRLAMYSEASLSFMKLVLKLIAAYLVFTLGHSYADNHSSVLTVKPNRCVALQQGQACFATLRFQWTTPASGEFCLFDERKQDPLVCWSGNTLAAYKQKFESNKNVKYEIRLKLSEQTLAQTMVKISWIYKSNTSSTSRWRLF